MRYIPAQVDSDCTLIWEELTNRPYTKLMEQNTTQGKWTDMTQDPKTKATFDKWNNRPRPKCPPATRTDFTDEDTPTYSTNDPRGDRILRFRITLCSGKDCPCGNK